MKKSNPDTGFASNLYFLLFLKHFSFILNIFQDFEQSTARTYERLTKEIEPDMENYEKQKAEL